MVQANGHFPHRDTVHAMTPIELTHAEMAKLTAA